MKVLADRIMPSTFGFGSTDLEVGQADGILEVTGKNKGVGSLFRWRVRPEPVTC